MNTMQELFEKIKLVLVEQPHSDSSSLIAQALASACNSSYSVSMLDIAIKLDSKNKTLINSLTHICSFEDYSNSLQDETLYWLREKKYIE
ncbi:MULTISPECIES: hypothetical protein [Marinomonas]|uniref:Uncharacterized protein n=1 Tax=Marinomonas rhodophyticola TaxID=2992803 RepID=A0ABT3KH76_9GAMM|nr:hypothetical protein [Marinomonas sp. KJ51-3]MCW4629417.1 hypothetical protein [Marinomonas sp. KJ51-3]